MSVGGVNGGFNNINPIKADTTINNIKKSTDIEKNLKVDNKPSLNLESKFKSTVNSKNASFEPVSLFSDTSNKAQSVAKNTLKTLSNHIDLEKGKFEVMAKNLLNEIKKQIKAD